MKRQSSNPAFARWLQWALPICCICTIGLGVAKVYIQKAHPPAYAAGKTDAHFYKGFVSPDTHCKMAELFRNWYTGDDPGGQIVKNEFANEMHPSAIVIPAAVGALDLIINFIPWSFMLFSAAAVVANAWLAAKMAAESDPGAPAEVPMIAALLVVAHCLTIRTSTQMILDPFCAVFASAAMWMTIRWTRAPGTGVAFALVIIQMLGMFTKVSYAPLLAAPALATFFAGSGRNWARGAFAALLFGAIPAAVWGIYMQWLTGLAQANREPEHLLNSWNLNFGALQHFAIEMALLFQGFFIILLLKWKVPGGAARVAGVTLALILLATWAFRLPAVPRLYLPALAPLAVLCILKMKDYLGGTRARHLVFGYLILNYAIGIWGLVPSG
ncbi:MAG: hypothetical protein HY286_01255 [Planctomycetes bacterium]|nr:hypothetical protein [Planctomycetota bacterium]